MQWVDKDETLIVGSKDKSLSHWKMPQYWRDEKLEAEEKNRYLIQKEQKTIEKFQQQQEKLKYDSDEDDLQGWHRF